MKHGGWPLPNKTCTGCGRDLPLSEYYPKGSGITARCKACIKKYNREHYLVMKDNPEFIEHRRLYSQKWHQRNRDRINARVAANHRKQRERCLEAYGGVCSCCGEARYEFLAIDHINGGGGKHRREIGNKITRWLIANDFPPGFRVLCHNCNQAIGHYGYCPHQKERSVVAA